MHINLVTQKNLASSWYWFFNEYSINYLNKEDFPIALQYSNNILSLPMYPELTDDLIYYIVNNLKNVLN